MYDIPDTVGAARNSDLCALETLQILLVLEGQCNIVRRYQKIISAFVYDCASEILYESSGRLLIRQGRFLWDRPGFLQLAPDDERKRGEICRKSRFF